MGGGFTVNANNWPSYEYFSENDVTAQVQKLVNDKNWVKGNAMAAVCDQLYPLDKMEDGYATTTTFSDGATWGARLIIRWGFHDWRRFHVPGETKTTSQGNMGMGNMYGNYLSPPLVWDAKGAKYAWMHYSGQAEGGNNNIKILAGVF
jgi:hypothetical protein